MFNRRKKVKVLKDVSTTIKENDVLVFSGGKWIKKGQEPKDDHPRNYVSDALVQSNMNEYFKLC